MHLLDNAATDVLRGYAQPLFSDRPASIKTIINHFYRFYITTQPDIIEKQLVVHDFINRVGDGYLITDKGTKYLIDVLTPQYYLDRIFEYLQDHNGWELLYGINSVLQLGFTDKDLSYYEAEIIDSGLVEYQKSGYYHSFRLNTTGIRQLRAFGKFSEYQKHF